MGLWPSLAGTADSNLTVHMDVSLLWVDNVFVVWYSYKKHGVNYGPDGWAMMQCVASDHVATVRNRVLMEGPVLRQLPFKIIHYAIQVLSILNNLIPAHILLQNFVTKFLIIYSYSSLCPSNSITFRELKRILISNKFF